MLSRFVVVNRVPNYEPCVARREDRGVAMKKLSVMSGALIAMVCITTGVLTTGAVPVGAVTRSATAKLNWTAVASSQKPPPTAAGTMAYDPVLGTDILFGGTPGTTGDTWAWNGTTWSIVATTGPAARQSMEMVYDAFTESIVLFGGISSTGTGLDDTWTFNGTWTKENPTTSPPYLAYYSMAYDAANNTVVLAGGQGAGGNESTWVWNGGNWNKIVSTPFTAPNNLVGATMSYDPALGANILFGGFLNGSHAHFATGTWEWNGSTWSELTTATTPPLRQNAVSFYDTKAGGVVVFGGYEPSLPAPSLGNDTWVFNGTDWSQLVTTSSPEPRVSAQAAQGANYGPPLLFGGYDSSIAKYSGYLHDTWTLET